MILVAGGTGRLGSLVVRRLRDRGLPVRVLTRDPARASHLAGDHVEVTIGDVRDPAAAERAVAGVATVVSAVHGFAGPGGVSPESVDESGNGKLIAAAERAGIDRFVLLSAVGASPDSPMSLFRAKHAAEQRLRAATSSWTIVRPTAFMETWAHLMAEMLRTKGKVTVFGRGANPINFVAANDVASLVERAATDPELAGRVLSIGGPDDVSFDGFATTLQDVTGETGRIVHVPRPVLRAMSFVMRPWNGQLARMARAAVVMDTVDMTMREPDARLEFPDLPCTDLATALQRAEGRLAAPA
jgi:NADH dehydrogenase